MHGESSICLCGGPHPREGALACFPASPLWSSCWPAKVMKNAFSLLNGKRAGRTATAGRTPESILDGGAGEDLEQLMRRAGGGPLRVFDVFLYANDYHNLKAAIKVDLDGQRVPRADIYIDQRDRGPEAVFRQAADPQQGFCCCFRTAMRRCPRRRPTSVLLQTGDGQLCDIIIDRAALNAIYAGGQSRAGDPRAWQLYART